jgi:hypothetical protein
MGLEMTIFQKACTALLVLALFPAAANAAVEISSKPTRNMSCNSGTCIATARKAALNAGDLQSMLALGDVIVKTGAAATDINVDQPLTWSSDKRLTLDARESVFVKKPVSVAGAGGLTLLMNDGGSGGDLSFSGKGHIEFQNQSSSLIINGNSYVLANTLADLGAGMLGNLNGFYALAKSYDASKDGIYTHAPLPGFAGTFEGLGNSVQNLSVRLAAHNTQGGLFSCGCPGSTLRDVAIEHAAIRGADNADVVGILAGVSYGFVKSVRVSGSVRGGGSASVNDTIGGLLGLAHGVVMDSHSSAKVSNGALMGGLVGDLDPAGDDPPTIVNSSATGDVVGLPAANAGGLVGDSGLTNASEIIENSFATGNVSVSGCNACGGLVASNVGAISNSYSTGAVTANGCSACGGLAGANSGGIAASYSTGAVVATGGLAGGSIGKDTSAQGKLNDAYWDTDTTGISNPSQGAGNIANDPGITGLSDEQLKSALPAGFDRKVWAQSPNTNFGYPYLLENMPG